MNSAKARPDGTVAVWGTFDLDNLGDQLHARISEAEILRRLPGWTVRTFAPFGWEHPCQMDGGCVSEPLGDIGPRRLTQLAGAADLTVICGDIVHADDDRLARAYGVDRTALAHRAPESWFIGGLGAELERRHPVIWSAVGVPADPSPAQADLIRAAAAHRGYLSVRDRTAEQRLRDCGLRQDIAIVPDLGVALHRLVRGESLKHRLDYFRLMGWYPVDRPALLVQADRSAVPLAKEIAKVIRWALEEIVVADVVLVETSPCYGDGEFADMLADQLDPARTFRLPAGLPMEDLLAAVYGSIGLVATSYHATLAAAMLGRRWALLDPGGATSASLVELLGVTDQHAATVGELAEAIRVAFPRQPDPLRYEPLRSTVDEHFDRIAEEADRAWRANGGDGAHRWAAVRRENAELRAAYRASRLRLAAERRKWLDVTPTAVHRPTESVSAEELARLRADSAELDRLLRTKLVRWSRPARRLYGLLTGRAR